MDIMCDVCGIDYDKDLAAIGVVSCNHLKLCIECHADIQKHKHFYDFHCYYCILDGDAQLLEEVQMHQCRGDFNEVCQPAHKAIKFGRQDACINGVPYQWDPDALNDDVNVECFRELYLLGFNSFQKPDTEYVYIFFDHTIEGGRGPMSVHRTEAEAIALLEEKKDLGIYRHGLDILHNNGGRIMYEVKKEALN